MTAPKQADTRVTLQQIADMMPEDLAKLGPQVLSRLMNRVSRAQKIARKQGKKNARDAAEAVAREHGYNLEELTTGSVTAGRREPEIRYRHPENPDLTWAGRGRRPRWISEAEAAGYDLVDLRV